MQCIHGASLSKHLVCSRITDKKNLPTEWFYEKQATFTLTNSANCTVLSTPLNAYRVSNNTICRLLVCSEWPPITNSIFTSLPLDGGLHCMYMSNYTTLRLFRSLPPSIQCFRKCDGTSPLGLYLLYSLLFMTSFAHALLPC